MTLPPNTLHATAVAVGGMGVLLMGPSGSGKSDLALRLIDRGAVLVADDRVVAAADGGRLRLAPPETIAGLIEVRGLGLMSMPHVADVAARLVVAFSAEPERLPEPRSREIEGIALPLLIVSPFEASAPLKVELAVAHFARDG